MTFHWEFNEAFSSKLKLPCIHENKDFTLWNVNYFCCLCTKANPWYNIKNKGNQEVYISNYSLKSFGAYREWMI